MVAAVFLPLYSQHYIGTNIQLPTYFSRNFQGWFTLSGNVLLYYGYPVVALSILVYFSY